jgi:predicted porin
MNKNIKLAVAGAVLALSASAANAGIIIPAGEWTLDINGNVNAFANYTKSDNSEFSTSGSNTASAALATGRGTGPQADKAIGINTGLLPAWLGFTGTTRQNDVDVSFTISMQPNVSDNGAAGDDSTPKNRQAFLTFGDKSWGSVKLGKDIGIFASDAILNDMTLLGVGAGAAQSGAKTTLGGIGTGYIYAAWKGQIAYTTPNFNGFQATVGITNPNQGLPNDGTSYNQDRFGLEGKASYSFSADNFSGKVWISGATYDNQYSPTRSYTISAGDIGATVTAGPATLTGYWYNGKGLGTTLFGANGYNTTSLTTRDSDGGYIQAKYATPFKTVIGLAYGVSNLDMSGNDAAATSLESNERYTVGLYHPLTKHLNLVAEFNNVQSETHSGLQNESKTYSAGGILFF